jgi:hypothetical protein
MIAVDGRIKDERLPYRTSFNQDLNLLTAGAFAQGQGNEAIKLLGGARDEFNYYIQNRKLPAAFGNTARDRSSEKCWNPMNGSGPAANESNVQ